MWVARRIPSITLAAWNRVIARTYLTLQCYCAFFASIDDWGNNPPLLSSRCAAAKMSAGRGSAVIADSDRRHIETLRCRPCAS
jgi:hypothetical protein